MRLFAFDIDGTLLPSGSTRIAEEDIFAIDSLLSRGDAIVLASGRPLSSLQDYLECFREGKKFAATANGTAIFSYDGEELYKNSLDPEMLTYVHSHYGNDEVEVYGYDDNSGMIAFRKNHWCDAESSCNHIPPEKLRIIKEGEKDFTCLKIMVCASASKSAKIEFDDYVLCHCDVVRSDPCYLEILPKGSDKATGVLELAKILGVKKEDVYCFGDEGNDIKMIASFHGIAMGNAIPEVKEKAEFITKPVTEHGVAYAISHFIK